MKYTGAYEVDGLRIENKGEIFGNDSAQVGYSRVKTLASN
jgi:hypothetical protein